jgi:hypothetical protein
VHQEVAVMADFLNPTRISAYALELSDPEYMASWAEYTRDPRFGWSATRLEDVRALADRLAGARDRLAPPA